MMKVNKIGFCMLLTCSFMLFTTLNSQSAWQWANHCGGLNSDYASRVCLDNTGNIFIAGRYFFPVGIFGRDTIPARGIYELFITKLDPNGSFLWTKPAGGINQEGGPEDIWDMFYDTLSNNLVLSGTMNGINKNMGGCTVGGNDVVFLSMLDKEGECLWAVKQADFGDPYMVSIYPDKHGNIYMVGNTRYKSYFNDTLTVHTGGFLAKFKKTDGTLVWTKKILDGNGYLSDICFYDDKLIIGGGSAIDVLKLDNTTIPCRNRDTFISQFDTMGNLVWARTMGGPNRDDGGDVQLDESGNIYTCGIYQGTADFGGVILENGEKEDIYLARFSSDGMVQWALQLSVTGNIYSVFHFTTKQGETFLNGSFSGNARFGEQTVTAKTSSDLFIAKYNSSGKCLNVITSGNSYLHGLATNNKGELFIAGSFAGTTYFGGTKLVSFGSEDAFFARHDALSTIPENFKNQSQTLLIYANPTTGKCTITIPEEFLHEKQLTLQLFDMQGKLLENVPVTMLEGKIKMNIEAQAKGMYHVTLGNGETAYRGKVVFE